LLQEYRQFSYSKIL